MDAHQRYLILTVDTEALPRRAPSDHIERLIWGRFDGKELGIGRMMDIADAVGVPITFFLDQCETALYGDAITQVGRRIVERGHDLQLHSHPELLQPTFWSDHGLEPPQWLPDKFDFTAAELLIRTLAEDLSAVRGSMPTAFRAGAYRFNGHLIKALKSHGIDLSFNNCKAASSGSHHYTYADPTIDLFRWSNGVVEVATTHIPFESELRRLSFPGRFPKRLTYADALEHYFQSQPTHRVAVMELHSWSLLHRSEAAGYFTYRDDRLAHEFETFLAAVRDRVTIVSASQLHQRLESGEIEVREERPLASANILVKSTQKTAGGQRRAFADENVQSDSAGTIERVAIIIGGMRCGSTALLRNLAQHPEICPYLEGEPHFFSSDENWNKGFDWYYGLWPEFDSAKHTYALEKCTHYTKYPMFPLTAERMAQSECDLKLIYIIRNPIDRIESQIAYSVWRGRLEFGDRANVMPHALNLSRYAMQLDHFEKHLPNVPILIVENADMRSDPNAVMTRCSEFLGIATPFPITVATPNERSRMEGVDRCKLSPEEREDIASALRSDVLRLQSKYGVDVSRWNIA